MIVLPIVAAVACNDSVAPNQQPLAPAKALSDVTSAATDLVMIDLGPGGEANDVNERGQIVGSNGGEAFLWEPGSGTRLLGKLPPPLIQVSSAEAINEAGDVVGVSGDHAFRWHAGSGMSDLGSLGGLAQTAHATDINDAGVVVGYSSSLAADNNDRGFVWTQTAGMRELPPIANSPRSSAFGVNTTGVAVGASYTSIARATLWQPDRTVVDLTSRISMTGLSGTEAMAINDAGSIVGFGRVAPDATNAFLLAPGTSAVFLGTLGGASSSATDINNTGAVVGYSNTSGGDTHAFLWTSSSGMRDLGTLGGTRSTANAINDAGWIVGNSTRGDGSVRLVLWRPNRPPTVDAGGPYAAKNKHTVFTFDASGSSDADGDALTYEWNFGDGSAVATGATAEHAYGEKGAFTVTLTVRDAFGATTVTTIPVIVGNPKKNG